MSYDVSVTLSRMEAGENVWDELWQELHHQGDVGEASYAAVPHLVRISATHAGRDWNLYALTATIEVEQHRRTNPPIPDWAEPAYKTSWQALVRLALADLETTGDSLMLRSALSVVALGRGDVKLGALLAYVESDEIATFVEEHMAWSQLYGQAGKSRR